MRVLLVDDEAELVSSMAERLDLRGIPTKWATSSDEAMNLLETEECFDIAVLDIKMPNIDGIELMRQIQLKCPSTEFIFLTGQASEQTYRQATEECARASYLVKPANINSLIDEMKKLMKFRAEHGV